MIVLTIDVGIINLALCCMTKINDKYKILFCELLNILEIDITKNTTNTTTDLPSINSKICNTLQKNKNKCKNKAKFLDNGSYYCKKHFKGTINKKTKLKTLKVNDFLLQDIAQRIIIVFNNLKNKYSSLFSSSNSNNDNTIIQSIQIELQPKLNNKMKFISHIIYGKLTEIFLYSPNTKIRFVAAKNKLKNNYTVNNNINLDSNNNSNSIINYKGKKNYKKRKQQSIDYVMKYLNDNLIDDTETWLSYFSNLKKCDDISDTILMAIYALK
jgi:hypothetical protein